MKRKNDVNTNGKDPKKPCIPISQRQNPSQIKNKMKRMEVMSKLRLEKKVLKKEKRLKKKKEREELGEEAPPKAVPNTLENTREVEKTTVLLEDSEVLGDEQDDEFSTIFSDEETPKLMITTRPNPSGDLYHFIKDLLDLFPNAFYYKRGLSERTYHYYIYTHYSHKGAFDIKDICKFASNKQFTHLVVLSEKSKSCNGALISRLPHGPTAFYKVSNVVLSQSIENHGKRTSHQPELILNNFTTRLGHRVGRFLGSLFPHDPNFKGRQVVTFHNQRDYIFVRQHRYIFENNKKARLQEIGPRFTLKLRWLQEGSFDTKFGEYEWIHQQHKMDTSRRKFHL